jgi:hypothetical protein
VRTTIGFKQISRLGVFIKARTQPFCVLITLRRGFDGMAGQDTKGDYSKASVVLQQLCTMAKVKMAIVGL